MQDLSPNSVRVIKVKRESIIVQYIKNKYFFFMLIPVILYYIIFHYVPMYGVTISFKDFYMLKGIMSSPWVGFKHFQELFAAKYFMQALRNTLIISFYKLIFGFPAPILLAIMLNEIKNMKFKRTVQSITYLPHFISWIVLSGLVIEILSPSRGPVNYLIQALGFKPIFFVADERWFRVVLVLSSIWRNIGWNSIIFLAAISNIDTELYDAASVDGAGRLRKIWNITLPSMMPAIVIMLIFASGSIINDDFDQIYNLLNSNVLSVGDVLSTYAYSEGIERMNYSYATAVGLFKNVIAFILIILTNKLAKRASEYAIW